MSYFQYHNKSIYYRILGTGQPLIFLHGDIASSKMFELLLPLYQDDFQIVLIDFLGCGQSERVKQFPVELWYDQALQTIALIEHLNYRNVHLIGTSGGAWTAMNDPFASQFYQWCQGDDWYNIVEKNTQSLLQLIKFQKPLFHKELRCFKNPILFTGSFEDKMLRIDLYEEYQEMIKMIGHGEIFMFETGKHLAMLSQAEDFARVVKKFIK